MVDILEFPKKDVIVIADTHGEFGMLLPNIEKYDLKDCIIIVAGDVGIGFYSEKYYKDTFEYINNEMLYRNINLLLLRGNHDDPYYFDNDIINFCNLRTIKDYTILCVGDEHILCVGGAISIDRTYRIENWSKRVSYKLTQLLYDNPNATEEEAMRKTLPSYWGGEKPKYDEEKLNYINDLSFNIDYVITHTSPSFSFKTDKNGVKYWMRYDLLLEHDLEEERSVFSKIYEFLTEHNNVIKKWVYGHFHEHNDDIIKGTRFIALANFDSYVDYHILNGEENSEN